MTKPVHPTTPASIDTIAPEHLASELGTLHAVIANLRMRLPGLERFTLDERKHTDGRIRGPEEAVALKSVIAAATAHPSVFQSLAAHDGGQDDAVFESQLLDARLARAVVLGEFAAALREFADELDDTALAQGEKVRPVLSAAYQIGKAQTAFNRDVAAKLQPAIEYYSALGRRAAASRKRNSNAPAT